VAEATRPAQRAAVERSIVDGTELTWALRSVLLGYDAVNRAVAGRLQLGANDVAALGHLLERPELGAAELADTIGITTASATTLIDRLEHAGHVTREPHPTDRRRKTIQVTQHAADSMLEVLQPLFDSLMAIEAHYDLGEREVVASYLRRVSAAYEQFLGADDVGG